MCRLHNATGLHCLCGGVTGRDLPCPGDASWTADECADAHGSCVAVEDDEYATELLDDDGVWVDTRGGFLCQTTTRK